MKIKKKHLYGLAAILLLLATSYFLDHLLVGTAGVACASMAFIGSVDDVSDRDTHGSNIAYRIWLVHVDQINRSVTFPKCNANREVGNIPLKEGEYMHYFDCHDIPTYTGTAEKGDITTSGENTFVAVLGGMRDQLLNFVEQYAGGKFLVLFKEVGEEQTYLLGSLDRPFTLSNQESKNDKDGRYMTLTFSRTSIDQYKKYVGAIATAPAVTHKADSTTLAVTSDNNLYSIADGTSDYAINAVSGLSDNDKGRSLTLVGIGDNHPATIPDGANFVLVDGATWTAKKGSSITLRVLDPTTLVEVEGSRIQTV